MIRPLSFLAAALVPAALAAQTPDMQTPMAANPTAETVKMRLIGIVEDWADHYSTQASYLRLNGILPPSAQPAAK